MSARDKSRQAPKSKHEFHLRKTQLFGPYGVGAIMPCPGGESLMICGLDAFPYKSDSDMEEVRDPRLAKHIGVRKLLAPRESTCIPATRFPRWLYCPECHTMVKCRDNDLKPPQMPESRLQGIRSTRPHPRAIHRSLSRWAHRRFAHPGMGPSRPC